MELEKCACCGASMSKRALACPMCGDTPNRRTFHDKLAWFVVWLFSIFSLLCIFWATFVADGISSPQQCAVIAGAIGFTLVPYCYARAVEKFE
ncbi:MAG TPA: hypothetical protein VFH59_11155 [Frateuria sp.]|uniref:hypothetical protein n=1 Tax=Frateuria sp. TaxID=2211372 RepID=UPI002D7E1EB7|nr:hypothetical protein [Frateuria sp.]HET6805985.1 hypothetical protein [Frateuria sp.]